MASKMDDIQKTMNLIIHEHLKYWKEIRTNPRRSGEDIQYN